MNAAPDRVHIDHLVLDGFELTSGQAESFQRYLAEFIECRLSDPGAADRLRSNEFDTISLGEIDAGQDIDPRDLAMEISNRLFKRLADRD